MPSQVDAVDVYWRPGCGACQRVQWDLRRLGVPARWHNIWEDEPARQLVRHAANGNDTVPTIVVGGTTLVAPSRSRLVAALQTGAPHLVAERRRRAWPLARIVQWLTIGALVLASELAGRAGHGAVSYGIDAAALAAYFSFRRVLRPPVHTTPSIGLGDADDPAIMISTRSRRRR